MDFEGNYVDISAPRMDLKRTMLAAQAYEEIDNRGEIFPDSSPAILMEEAYSIELKTYYFLFSILCRFYIATYL